MLEFGGAILIFRGVIMLRLVPFADRNRLLPAPEFDGEKDRIAATPISNRLQFVDETKLYHTEGQYDFSKWTNK